MSNVRLRPGAKNRYRSENKSQYVQLRRLANGMSGLIGCMVVRATGRCRRGRFGVLKAG
jgi:hypothetical protein